MFATFTARTMQLKRTFQDLQLEFAPANEDRPPEYRQNCVRVLTSSSYHFFHNEQQCVLVLHDFYQNPFAIAHLVNHLSQNQFDVICPWVGDLLQMAPGQKLCNCMSIVKQILERLNVSQVSIIAQGSSCELALLLEKQVQCGKVVLCNPV